MARSDNRTFMGIPVEGDVYAYGYTSLEQYSIEKLYGELQELFAAGVVGIMWHQYIPGFNDGDPCEFTLGEVYMTSNQIVADAWLDGSEPDLEEAYPGQEFDYYDEGYYGRTSSHPDGLEIGALRDSIDGHYENVLREMFGYNTNIVVTPTRVVQFEYECGY